MLFPPNDSIIRGAGGFSTRKQYNEILYDILAPYSSATTLNDRMRGLTGYAALAAAYETTYPPDFHYLATDLGAGIASITPAVAPGGVPTFTRASAAWTRAGAGDSWVLVGAGDPRAYYGADGTFLGLLSEQARTASGLGIRDLTNVAWVAGGAPVVAKDGTGIDGIANSCSTITAGAANDTVTQTIVVAAANKVFQPFIKRLIGTGTVEITIDGGATWTDVTSQLNTSFHVRCEVSANIANPQYGFRLGTVGDKISVDMCELQNGLFATTPIGSAVSRGNDSLQFGAGSFTAAGAFTMYAEGASVNKNTGGGTLLNVNDGTTANRNVLNLTQTNGTTVYSVFAASVIQANPNVLNTFSLEQLIKVCGRTATNDVVTASDGQISAPYTAATIPAGLDRVSQHLNATAKGVTLLEAKIFYYSLPNIVVQGITE